MGEVGIEARRSSWVIIKRKDIHPSKDASENAPRSILGEFQGGDPVTDPPPHGIWQDIITPHAHLHVCAHKQTASHCRATGGNMSFKKGSLNTKPALLETCEAIWS